MQILGHGRSDHLARLLLGVQDAGATVSRVSSSGRDEAGRDQVHISFQAQEMRRILALTRESDQARIEHIDRIKQVMEGETYDVSGRKVGDALIKEVLTDAVLAVL